VACGLEGPREGQHREDVPNGRHCGEQDAHALDPPPGAYPTRAGFTLTLRAARPTLNPDKITRD
jgi:hypothetical protein